VVRPIVRSPRYRNYRSKITPHFGAYRPEAQNVIGFKMLGPYRNLRINITSCEIATTRVNTEFEKLRREVLEQMQSGNYTERGAVLLLREVDGGHVATDPRELVTISTPTVEEDVASTLKFEIPSNSFFQVNEGLLPVLISHVVRELGPPREDLAVLDLFCGVGLFGLAAAQHGHRNVLGLESSEAMVKAAAHSASLNGLQDRARFQVADLMSSVDIAALVGNRPCVAIIDPTRDGCDEHFITTLRDVGPERVVYISCNPRTQVRDLQPLLDGGYRITAVQPFDMFPQTNHVECVVSLHRVPPSPLHTRCG